MKPKVTLLARVNDGTKKFPFFTCELSRRGIVLPVESPSGRLFHLPDISGFYARYTDLGRRVLKTLGKDPTDAYSLFQAVERDSTRVKAGLLPLNPTVRKEGRTLRECAVKFERKLHQQNRKRRTVESYMRSVDCLTQFCAEREILAIDDLTKDSILDFVGWMQTNIPTRTGGHKNNTYRNKLKDLKIFLHYFDVDLPLATRDWPKKVKARKEKYSLDAVKAMLDAADTRSRHDNLTWSKEDDKDLVHFLVKTGFRDEEMMYAQYSDINFRNSTVNVTAKPKGSFPNLPDLEWMPKDNEARQDNIVVDDSLLRRMKARKERHAASSSSLIFPNTKGKPDHHLVRVVHRLAKEAGVEGKIGLHKFRKTFATLIAKEEGIERARILLGHNDVQTTAAYLAADEIAPEVERKNVKRRFVALGD